MKIAEVTTTLGMGGAEKLVAELSSLLSKRKNVKIKVISILSIREEPYEILKKNNIEVIELAYKKLFNPMIAIDLYRNTKDCDIVHTHTFYAQLYSAALIKKEKLITTEHSTYNRRRKFKMFKIIDFFMYSKYKKIICISNATKHALNNWLKSTIKKTKVINNGVDIEKYKNAIPLKRSDLEINKDKIVLTCVARLEEIKNHKTLIKAMKTVNENVQLLLVGDGSMRTVLKEEIIKLNLEDRVKLLGNRKEVERILKTSDIFILPSIWEGFGLVVVEAAASGLPIIISDVSGMKDLFKNSEIELIDPKDYRDISEKINYVANNLKSVNKSYDDINRYSIECMVEKYMRSYVEMERIMASN